MLGRESRRKTVAQLAGLGLCAALIFTWMATTPQARGGDFLDRVRDGVRGGLRALAGGGADAAEGAVIVGRSARAMAQEEDAKARDASLVRMRGFEFRPETDSPVPTDIPELIAPPPPIVAAELRGTPEGDAEYWLIQYSGRAPAFLKAVDAAGGEVVQYVSNSAYIVRVWPESASAVTSLPEASWAGRYLPAYSITPGLRELLADAKAGALLPVDELGLLRLEVEFHRGALSENWLTELKAVPGVEVLAHVPDPTTQQIAKITVVPERLRQAVLDIALFNDVSAIVSDPLPRLHNDHSVWYMQTGIDQVGTSNYPISAKLFARGITGRGMLGAVADDGLENDLCYFRYGVAIHEAGWPLGPTALAITPVPPEDVEPAASPAPARIRTRGRKVVTYYVMQAAAAYSTDIQHGTGTSGCMLADDFSGLAARPLVRDLGQDQNVPPQQRTGTWTFGQELRPSLSASVDNPGVNDPALPTTFGSLLQHHQARDGMAPGAQLVFQDIGNATGTLSGVFTGASLYNQAQGTGATVHNASFGGDVCTSCYAGNATGGDSASWQRRDLLGFSSAGNDGSLGAGTIGSGFAQGMNIVTVGATERGNTISALPATRTGENVASYSGKGPKSGGLLAPDLLAPGSIVTATESAIIPEDGTGSGNGGCGPAVGGSVTGTSFSGPTLAGTALLVQQYFMDGYYPSGAPTAANGLRPTNALIRAVMTNSARNLLGARTADTGVGQADRPTFSQGWGAPRLDDTLYFSGDPTRDDPRGDTERARLLVLTDTPNGYETGVAIAGGNCAQGRTVTEPTLEPGGQTRGDIVQNLRPALTDAAVADFFLNVINPMPSDVANELRITMAYMDYPGATGGNPVVNDLDLEVISPGPNGLLETVSDTLAGDDIVYRTAPLSAWSGGYTVPSPTRQIQRFMAGVGTDFPDRDPLNPVENVFIRAADVVPGSWRLRVIAYDIRAGVVDGNGRPDYVLGDRPCSIDSDGDTTADREFFDRIDASKQGYSLVVSGNFTTTQGLVSLNRSQFDCSGQDLIVTLNDENGNAVRTTCDPEGDGTFLDAALTVTVTTTTASPAFPADLEIVTVTGTQPSYLSPPLPVIVTNDPAAVIHGNGRVEIASGEQIIANYVDANPCGGSAFAQAAVGCSPTVSDQGFRIEDGCDFSVPGNPASTIRPDGFMDADELVRYTVFFQNDSADDLHDLRVTLVPDPADPVSAQVTVLSPQTQIVPLAPPGRRADAVFLVKLGSAIPPRYSMDFIVEFSSPVDGLFFPDRFIQEQVLEADVESFRYDTRDPNGELFGINRIEVLVPDAVMGSVDPADYVENAPMWFDPDADCSPMPGVQPCSTLCEVPRNMWPSPTTPPAQCVAAMTGNVFNPWDFDDSDEGFQLAVYEGDANRVTDFYWKNGPTGGGCGWENQLNDQLSGLPAGHPDKIAQPWGIWHTGRINNTTSGPFAGQLTNNQGAPYFEDAVLGDQHPSDHSILWDSTTMGGTNNTMGTWCQSYLSDPVTYAQFYRFFLVPPALFRVHASDPSFKVEFEELKFYTRMDGHTIDGDNLSIASWLVNNQPVTPVSTGPDTYSWAQYQYRTHIFSDKVREEWDVDDNDLSINIGTPNGSFPDLTYEDIYGPAADSWNFAFGWSHLHFDGRRSKGQYGWGIDDVSFAWRETREVPDGSDCNLVPGGQAPTLFFDENRYNACRGNLNITLFDRAQMLNEVAVCVTSGAEDYEMAVLRLVDASTGRYQGRMPFSVEPREDVVGTLLVSAGSVDVGQGADTVRVEYDPENTSDHDLADAAFSIQEACDWADTNPADGRNDNLVDNVTGMPPPDDIPDAEDGVLAGAPGRQERADTSVINCTSGRVFYIKHQLQQDGPGDGDKFADHGESQFMALSLLSQLTFDLQEVEVSISTLDTTVCIQKDTVAIPLLPGNGMLTQVPNTLTDGFRFSVPQAVQTTTLAAPQTVTFRVNVRGRSTADLNEFSTEGEGFNTFLPQEARLILDVDQVVTTATYDDNTAPRTGRLPGQYLERFEGQAAAQFFDHPFIGNVRPGVRADSSGLDATVDSRFGVNLNEGFCPECDATVDCVVPDDCRHFMAPDTGNPLRPGYPRASEWKATQDWAKAGLGAYKFGLPNAGPAVSDQHYAAGQYTAVELPPLRLASDPSVTPQLRFWHVADFWRPNFTGGLRTPVGAGVLEIAASAQGVMNSANLGQIQTTYPISSFQRLYPLQASYETETDVLNVCQTLFCQFKHPVFGGAGSFIVPPGGAADPEAGTVGPATWKEVVVDLSDYKGREVVIRLTAQVMQDLDIQAGSFGWMIDDVSVTGVQPQATAVALRLQVASTATPTCSLAAAFDSTSADCVGEWMQLFDRHAGLGSFTAGVPDPVRHQWAIPGLPTIGPGAPGALVGNIGAGIDPTSTFDNPRINLTLAGRPPGRYPVTYTLLQGASSVQTVQEIVLKDAPVPVVTLISAAALAGGTTRFSANVTFDASIDATRSFVYEWNFGDGTPIATTGATVDHVYAATGNYTVTLTVYDEDGCPGVDTLAVNVVAAPSFANPTSVFGSDCAAAGSPGLGDGNADINEYVTMNVGFTNSGAAATGVNGFLTSSSPYVEITRGAASYGNVGAGAMAAVRPFTFIRRPEPMQALGCLTVPFTLTLVSDGGSVVQQLSFAFTMGQATDVPFAPAAPGPGSFCAGDQVGSAFTFNAPGGCLNGQELALTVTGTGQATMNRIEVRLESPTFQTVVLVPRGSLPPSQTFILDYAFGADDGDAPIRNTGGTVDDVAGSLSPATEDSLITLLTGVPMAGTWRVVVRDGSPAANCPGTFNVTIGRFRLEGTNSNNLQIGTEAPCTTCLTASAPLFAGARAVCVGPQVTWSPAVDTSVCDGVPDLTYEIYASRVPGQRGNAATPVANCAACPMGMDCYITRAPGATVVDVCDVEGAQWTVVAVDTSGAGSKTPVVPLATTVVPAGYQTALQTCTVPPTGGHTFRLNGGPGGSLTISVVPGSGGSLGIDAYRVYRGTFTLGAGGLQTLRVRDTVDPFDPYDHVIYDCGFVVGSTFDISVDRGTPGSFYYLVPAINPAGCVGLGYQGTPRPGFPGTLERVTGRPPGPDTCPGDPIWSGSCNP